MVAESGGSISRFILFVFHFVLDRTVPFPLSSFPLLIQFVESLSLSLVILLSTYFNSIVLTVLLI